MIIVSGVRFAGSAPAMSDVTHILDRVQQGDAKAAEELLPLVYEELRKLAAARMAAEQSGHTLQPTALVWFRWPGVFPPRKPATHRVRHRTMELRRERESGVVAWTGHLPR